MSKQKGNSFERRISKILSERFASVTGVEQGFRRNPDSGSYFGRTNVRRAATHNLDKAVFGDLICPDAFIYSIECKHYKDPPSFNALFTDKIAEWDGWIAQAEADATVSGKRMCLIVKYNRVDEIVILDRPVPGVRNWPYQRYHIVRLTDFLTQGDADFFGDLATP